MADRSKIEWTDATWNPIRARLLANAAKVGFHCEHVSEACRNCYAEAWNAGRRLGTGLPYKPGHRRDVEIILDERALLQPLRWRRPRLIFVCSMTDLFADFVPDQFIDRMFAVMAACPQHTFQVLTKRPERMRRYFETPSLISPAGQNRGREMQVSIELQAMRMCGVDIENPLGGCEPGLPLPNVWLGTSVEDQGAAAARIPELLATPASVRFLSCEPLLGPVDLVAFTNAEAGNVGTQGDAPRSDDSSLVTSARAGAGSVVAQPAPRIDWVIAGGESGHKARPMHPDWARQLRNQCAAAGVPFTFKQWGEWASGVTARSEEPGRFAFHWPHDVGRWSYFDHSPRMFLRFGADAGMTRLGKKKSGRLLDGVLHDGRPA